MERVGSRRSPRHLNFKRGEASCPPVYIAPIPAVPIILSSCPCHTLLFLLSPSPLTGGSDECLSCICHSQLVVAPTGGSFTILQLSHSASYYCRMLTPSHTLQFHWTPWGSCHSFRPNSHCCYPSHPDTANTVCR